ncbi:hypothetical protein BaRGS_00016717 [Batillaria attramentaria]|uniref:Uncharacterized protein n=1 Tax=Batillaria attramentaria TaxID=370345 RepID=A0ABD0KXM6_9CAEN
MNRNEWISRRAKYTHHKLLPSQYLQPPFANPFLLPSHGRPSHSLDNPTQHKILYERQQNPQAMTTNPGYDKSGFPHLPCLIALSPMILWTNGHITRRFWWSRRCGTHSSGRVSVWELKVFFPPLEWSALAV